MNLTTNSYAHARILTKWSLLIWTFTTTYYAQQTQRKVYSLNFILVLKQSFKFFQISYLSVQLYLRIHECVTYAKILESQPNSHTNIRGKKVKDIWFVMLYQWTRINCWCKTIIWGNPFQNAIKRWNFRKPHMFRMSEIISIKHWGHPPNFTDLYVMKKCLIWVKSLVILKS